MTRLVAIMGPTATGKSDLALSLALSLNGEVVSADSRQVYRYMDIGTAKPDAEALAAVPHHIIDVVDPDQDFSLALFKRMAGQAIEGIHARGRLPIVAGGTGQYIWSLLEGWQVPAVPPDPDLRRGLEARAAQDGGDGLYRELEAADPEAARRIDRRNVRRVIRALEIFAGGARPSSVWTKCRPPFETLVIGLTASRQLLYQRIDSRVDSMMEQGLLREVQELVARGYSPELHSMSGLGYKQMGLCLGGKLGLNEAVQQTKMRTHSFARRQYAWFRLADRRIHWFDIESDCREAVLDLVGEFMEDGLKAMPLLEAS